MRRIGAGIAIVVLAACGGGSSGGGTGGGGVCKPGETRSCTAANGCSGEQVCFSTGKAFGPCVCSTGSGGSGGFGGTGAVGGGGSGGVGGSGAAGGTGGAGGSGATGGSGAGGTGGSGGSTTGLPATCTEAATAHTYVGCEFWPTVTPNLVWSIFDYAVLVENPGAAPASVTVMRGTATEDTETVQPGGAVTIYLPWVTGLKGADADNCGAASASGPTARVNQGAYHVTSTVPVAAYQFNALEYQASGGPAGKDWSTCPGSQTCSSAGTAVGCYAYSNDASLLLPTTSLGTSYRVAGLHGWAAASIGPYVVVTGTHDATTVTLKMPAATALVAGAGISAAAGATTQFTLDAGDVVELAADATGDLGGMTVSADHPIQLVTGMACVQAPVGTQACDHVEETLPPASALGRHYLVAAPTGPHGAPVGHIVRLFGNADGTTLSYPAGTPPGAPTTLAAGQVVDLGNVTTGFEVDGDKPFAVASVLVGGALLDPGGASGQQLGDPSLTMVPPLEQFRASYAFVSASGYDATYLDVVAPALGVLTLDGQPVTATGTPLGSASAPYVYRIKLATAGAHTLQADEPVGVLLTGYGLYTSYAYAAGMNVAVLP